MKNIRVSFAREKGKLSREDRLAYGFTASAPFPFTDAGVKGEAIVLRWRLTITQNLRNLFKEQKMNPEFDLKEGVR